MVSGFLSNESIKRISISNIINQANILELFNSFTLQNTVWPICIPFSVSDGMSNSDSIIKQHSLISLSLYHRNYIHLHWMKIEKGDLINQSSLSVLLFIINSFDSTVLLSPYPLRAAISRVMDWSRFKSHSSFINHLYSQTLLNDSNGLHTDPTEWKWEKEDPSIQMIHTKRMNNIQYGFVSIDHNSLSNICFLLYPPYPILNYLFQW